MLHQIGLSACVLMTSLLSLGAFISTPDGPPTNALRRYEPKKYEIRFKVTLQTVAHNADARQRGNFNYQEAPIVLPVIYRGAYSSIAPDTVDGWLILGSNPVTNLVEAIDDNKPFNTHHLRIVSPPFSGITLQFGFSYTMQSWSAKLDEQQAQKATWPRDMEWPDDVKDGLMPQTYIESDEQIFQNAVNDLQRNLNTDLRTMSPYMVAKAVVAYVLNNFQVNGTGVTRGGLGEIKGLNMRGALNTANTPMQNGRLVGTEHDLVAVCVAMLRAANIPARPVIGIEESQRTSGRKRTQYVSWAEFYLPGSGWVSFDPHAMLDHGGGQYRNPRSVWPEFGNLDELNERIPLSYHFHPSGANLVSPGYYALWGWDPRPQSKQDSYEQAVMLQITSRGKGVDDPG